MDQHATLDLVKQHAPIILQYVLMALGVLVVLGRAYIKITPTQDDDAFLQKLEEKKIIGSILKLLIQFSPVERKELVIEEKKNG